MSPQNIQEKYPKASAQFEKWVLDSYGIVFDTLSEQLLNDMFFAFISNGLLTEFFREHKIFFSIMPRFSIDDEIIDYTLEVCYGVKGWTGYHKFISYEEANNFGTEKCFEILEDRIE